MTAPSPDLAAIAKPLRAGARALGVDIDDDRVARLAHYAALLQTWGARMNLSAILTPAEIVTRHFLDSLALCARLPATVPGGTLIDVGSGAGFPGALCALWRPDWRVTLIDRTQKKVAFLMTLRRELALPNLDPQAVDVRALIKEGRRFGCVVSRAAFPPPEWLTLGAALCAPGGSVWQLLTAAQAEAPSSPPPPLVAGIDEPYDVGAGPHRVRSFTVP